MKSVKPKAPNQDRTIIIVKDGDGFEMRVWNRLTGDGPIGMRLARKDGLPNLPVKTSTFNDALQLLDRWQAWLNAQPITGRGKGRRK